MPDYLTSILQWINLHPHFAGLATFIISAAESVAIIGTIIPGSIMMTAIGALAGAGVMPLWSTIIWAILGAIVGDGISYWIGYHFKDRLHYVWPFRKHPILLATGEKFFHKHGGKSVFIGRFVGPVRALVPLVAGMLNMKPWRFIIANVTSAIGWAPAYMLPGILLGAASLELPPDIAVHALLMLVLAGLFIILCLWLIRKLFVLIGEQINQVLTQFWKYLQTSRYFSIVTIALRHHDYHKTYGQLTTAFYFLLVSIIFICLAITVKTQGSESFFINESFFHLFRSIRTPLGDTIMIYITLLGEAKVLLPVIATLFMWLAATKRWHTAWHVLALGVITTGAVEGLKHFVHSPRPWGIVQSPSGYSFPSGHATYATAFFLGISTLLIKSCNQHCRRFFYSIAVIIITAISFSRLYLGAHWLTDVVGGILLGIAILMLIVLSYRRQKGKKLLPLGIFVTTFLTLAISYSVVCHFTFPTLKKNQAQIDWPTQTVSLDTWWKQQDTNLPLYRISRFGFSNEILNLQWLDNISNIQTLLFQNGWETPPDRDLITILHRISDIQSAEHFPLVSPLYLDKTPTLVLVKRNGKRLIVLRLWQSNIEIQNTTLTLWVGVVEPVPRTYSWLFKHKRNDFDLEASMLFKGTPNNYDVQKTVKHLHHRQQKNMILIKPKKI